MKDMLRETAVEDLRLKFCLSCDNTGCKNCKDYDEFIKMITNKKKIYAIYGASASGKTTLGRFLQSIGVIEMVSDTTRDPRFGEIEGKTYYFRTKETFDKLEKIEYTEYAGNYYCLSKQEVDTKLSMYDKVFAIVDIEGVRQLKERYGDMVVVIYIKAPHIADLVIRMYERGDSIENIRKRVDNIFIKDELDYEYVADFVIENNDLDESKEKLRKIVEG